jgi:outer membrane lipoprotein-sorting protein
MASILAIVVIAGCVGQAAPREVVEAAIAKQASFLDYEIIYNVSYLTGSAGQELGMSGAMRIVKKGADSRLGYDLGVQGSLERLRFDVYSVPNGTFQCFSTLGDVSCLQLSAATQPVPSPVEQARQLSDLLNRSIITLSDAGSKSFAGRGCKAVDAVFDVARLASEDGLGLSEAGNLKSLRQTICYDEGTGLPLQLDMALQVEADDGDATARLSTVALEIKESASEIALPAGSKIITLDEQAAAVSEGNGTFQ